MGEAMLVNGLRTISKANAMGFDSDSNEADGEPPISAQQILEQRIG